MAHYNAQARFKCQKPGCREREFVGSLGFSHVAQIQGDEVPAEVSSELIEHYRRHQADSDCVQFSAVGVGRQGNWNFGMITISSPAHSNRDMVVLTLFEGAIRLVTSATIKAEGVNLQIDHGRTRRK